MRLPYTAVVGILFGFLMLRTLMFRTKESVCRDYCVHGGLPCFAPVNWRIIAAGIRSVVARRTLEQSQSIESCGRRTATAISAVVLILAAAMAAQDIAPAPIDPLNRTTPQEAVVQFLEACHARQYRRAAHYLDLRQMSAGDREKNGQELARQLEDLLDDSPFDIATLSRSPQGDLDDGLPPSREPLIHPQVDGHPLRLELEHVELKPGLKVWLVSADSVPLIPQAHKLLAETPFEKKLPQVLVTHEFLDTPLWRWLVILAGGVLAWLAARLLAFAIAAAFRRAATNSNRSAELLRGPMEVALAVAVLRAAIEFAPPSAIVRLYLERSLTVAFVFALAWAGATVIDMVSERWRSRLDLRMKAMTYSILPLGKQVLKLFLLLIAALAVLSAWGFNTTTIMAGLGVGGLAVALAAQKTIENLFGGISVIGDRPVLVGDFGRFGNHMGTVMHIGLRSTRIRTLDRTVVSLPNSQFSTMELENFSARDKIWFHQVLSLRRDTTSEQLRQVLSAAHDVLHQHPKVEVGDIPVRFNGIGSYSLDVEVFAYVLTPDFDVFLGIQQELLLDLLQAVELAGTGLAVPLYESLNSERSVPMLR
jgi:MscS family membrane protein